jgi:hypothetical protein
MDRFRPKWKYSHSSSRMDAVKVLPDQSALTEAAKNDDSESVRRSAEMLAATILKQSGRGSLGWCIGKAAKQKVGVMSMLTETQGDIAGKIIGTNKFLIEKGYGCFNLVITPNHDITEFIADELVRRGVRPTEIGFHSLNHMNRQLLTSLGDRSAKEEILKGVQSSKFREIMTSDDMESSLASLADTDQVALLLNILKVRVKAGELRYAVADAFLVGRDWDVGEMNAPDTVKKLRGSEMRIKAILWLVNMDRMTEQQVREGAARIDPFGDRRFHSSVYDKALIQVTSVQSAATNSILRNAAEKNHGWNINLIINNLPEVVPLDESI